MKATAEPKDSTHNASGLDALFLFLLSISSSALYIGKLGFYNDDWAYLADLEYCPDRSLWGLFKCFSGGQIDPSIRPVQALYLTSLYRVFGLEPLGHHIVNSVMMAGTLVLLYLTLRRVGINRLFSVAVASVYGLMPQ